MPHHVIIGAGIGGLALGYFLRQKAEENFRLTILEASDRVGGWIKTKVEEGFLFEQGPRSFRPEGSGIATLQLIESLGLQDEIIFASKAAAKRYLYTAGQLCCLPTGPMSFLRSSFKGKILKAIRQDLFAEKGVEEDESIHRFVERRFGAEIADLFFDPLISGIYAGDIKQLSIQSCFPSLQALERNHRSLILGSFKKRAQRKAASPFVEHARRQGLFTLRCGVQSLVDALVNRLSDNLKLSSEAKKITFAQDTMTIELSDNKHIVADKLYLAVPAHSLANLIGPEHPAIRSLLNGIPSASIAVINLGYETPVLNREGFGYLIPSKEKQNLLGVVWDSSAFPEQNAYRGQTRLTAMAGGVQGIPVDSLNTEALIEIALKDLQNHLGIKRAPDRIECTLAKNAIPQYLVGHRIKVKQIEESFASISSNITLLGNAFHGISVNDCIAKSLHCSESFEDKNH